MVVDSDRVGGRAEATTYFSSIGFAPPAESQPARLQQHRAVLITNLFSD